MLKFSHGWCHNKVSCLAHIRNFLLAGLHYAWRPKGWSRNLRRSLNYRSMAASKRSRNRHDGTKTLRKPPTQNPDKKNDTNIKIKPKTKTETKIKQSDVVVAGSTTDHVDASGFLYVLLNPRTKTRYLSGLCRHPEHRTALVEFVQRVEGRGSLMGPRCCAGSV